MGAASASTTFSSEAMGFLSAITTEDNWSGRDLGGLGPGEAICYAPNRREGGGGWCSPGGGGGGHKLFSQEQRPDVVLFPLRDVCL